VCYHRQLCLMAPACAMRDLLLDVLRDMLFSARLENQRHLFLTNQRRLFLPHSHRRVWLDEPHLHGSTASMLGTSDCIVACLVACLVAFPNIQQAFFSLPLCKVCKHRRHYPLYGFSILFYVTNRNGPIQRDFSSKNVCRAGSMRLIYQSALSRPNLNSFFHQSGVGLTFCRFNPTKNRYEFVGKR